MGKLQPNFSWQKYEGKQEDQKEQFQYQLQAMFIQIANTTNSTIDDASFFTRERQTSETWLAGQPIFTKTIVVTMPNAGTSSTPHGITTIVTEVSLSGQAQPSTFPASGQAIPLPYVNSASKANDIEINIDNTNVNVKSGANYSTYTGTVTIKYTKK